MKTIILAGGWGSRLGQISELVPKPMVTIGDKPILWHIMKIYSHYGFNEFIVALGVKGHIVKEYFYDFEALNNDFTINLKNNEITYHGSHNETGWQVTLMDTGINTLKGGRIKRVSKHLDGDVNMLTYGDGISDINIRELIAFHKSHGKTITITGVHPTARFGELELHEGKVRSFKEKPKSSESYINGGFMVFNRNLLDLLTEDENCDFEYGPLEELAAAGEVMAFKHDGNWECMDTQRDVVHLNNLWNSNRAFWKVW